MAVDCINHESRECEPGHENNKNQHIQVLETEYRYLSLAQEKLRKHSAEWFFLESKLIAVEKEMDALPIKNTIRSDDEKHHSRTVADDAPLPDRTDSPKAESTSGSEDSQEEDLIDLDTSESSPLGDRPDSPMDESISGFIAKNSVANNVAYDVPREHSKDDDLIDLGLSESNESSENVLDNNSKSVQHLYDNDRLNAAHNQLEEIHRQLAELHKHHTLFMKSQHHSPEPSSPVSTTSSSSSSFSSESGEESPAYRPNRQYSARENYIDWDQSENEISRQIGEIRKRPTSLTRSQYTESTASASVSSASSAENEDILVPVDLGTHESDASYGDSKSTDSYMHNKGQLAFTQGGVEKSPQELKSLISPSQESQSLASVSSNENNDGLGCAHEHLHSIQEDNVQLDTAQDQLEEIHRQLTILYSQHSMFMESQHIDNSNESFSDSSTSSSTGSSETEQVSEDGPNHQNYSGEEKSQREQERLIPPSQQSQLTAHPTNPYSTAIQTDEKDISKNPYASYTWRKCMMIVFPLLVAAAFGFLLIFKPSTFSEDEGSTRDEAGINYDNPKGVSFHTSMGSITPPCTPFSIHLITDQFGNETSWNLLRLEEVNDENKTDKMENIAYIYDGSELRAYDGGGQVSHREDGQIRFLRSTKQVATESIKKSVIVMSGGPYSYQDEFERGATGDEYQMIDADICLPVGKYQFIIYDTEGDGMCCYYGHGKYGLHFPGGREVRPLSIGQFLGAHEVTAFEVTNTDINLANSEEDSQLQTGDDADVSLGCTFASSHTHLIALILLFSHFLRFHCVSSTLLLHSFLLSMMLIPSQALPQHLAMIWQLPH